MTICYNMTFACGHTVGSRNLDSYGEAAHDCLWVAIRDGSGGQQEYNLASARVFLQVQMPP